MKAGTWLRSARLSQRSFAISEVSTKCPARLRHQPRQPVGRMHDVGIGQQQIVRLRVGFRRLDALPQRPQFPGPAGGRAAACHHD